MAQCMTTIKSGSTFWYAVPSPLPTDPSSCTAVALTGQEWQTFTQQAQIISQLQTDYQTLLNYQAQSFDLTQALAAFSFFFVAVMLSFFWGKTGGSVLEAIRHPLRRN